MDSKSDVAGINEQRALEYEAAESVVTQPRITSWHDFIEYRQAKIDDNFRELLLHMKPKEVMQLVMQREKTGNGPRSACLKNFSVNGKQ